MFNLGFAGLVWGESLYFLRPIATEELSNSEEEASNDTLQQIKKSLNPGPENTNSKALKIFEPSALDRFKEYYNMKLEALEKALKNKERNFEEIEKLIEELRAIELELQRINRFVSEMPTFIEATTTSPEGKFFAAWMKNLLPNWETFLKEIEQSRQKLHKIQSDVYVNEDLPDNITILLSNFFEFSLRPIPREIAINFPFRHFVEEKYKKFKFLVRTILYHIEIAQSGQEIVELISKNKVDIPADDYKIIESETGGLDKIKILAKLVVLRQIAQYIYGEEKSESVDNLLELIKILEQEEIIIKTPFLAQFMKFKNSINRLRETTPEEYKRTEDLLVEMCAKHKPSLPKSIILYADSLLENGGVVDFEIAFKTLCIYKILNKVIIYSENPEKGKILELLIKNVKSDLEIVHKYKSEFQADISEVEILEVLIELAGSKNILCIIKGETETLKDLGALAKDKEIPIMVFKKKEEREKAIYSISVALGAAIILQLPQYKEEDFLRFLWPIKDEGIENEFIEYQKALKELVGA